MSSSTDMHPGMQVVDQRVRSFAAITKPKSAARPGWPLDPASYPRLTPQQLADAGFYYDPADGIDTCKCFSCGIKLGGWEEGDDPLDEHWARREKCAWAELMCAMYMEKRDGTRSDIVVKSTQLPQSKQSILIRSKTYGEDGEWWPHQAQRGWGPTVKNLATAGFVYTPGDASDDAVMCPLCGYSVEGWEKSDDPWDIHQKKKPNCRFFTMRLEPSATKGKQRATRAPTQQQPTDAPSDVNEIEVNGTPQPSQPKKRGGARGRPRGTAATATTAPATPSQATRPGRRKGTRAGTAALESEVGESGAEVDEGDTLPEVVGAGNETPGEDEKRGKAAGKSKASRVTRTIKDAGGDGKSAKSTRGRRKVIEVSDDEEDGDGMRGTDKEGGIVATPMASDMEESDAPVEDPQPSTAKGRKPRTTTRTAKTATTKSKSKSAATAVSRRKTTVQISDNEGLAGSTNEARTGNERDDDADILVPATVEHFDYPSDREATPQPSQAQKKGGRPRAASRAVGVTAEAADTAAVSEVVPKKAGRKTIRQSTAQIKAPRATKGRPTQTAKTGKKAVGESKSEPVMRGKRSAVQQVDVEEDAEMEAGGSVVDSEADADEHSKGKSSRTTSRSKASRLPRELKPSAVSSYRTARTAQPDQTRLYGEEADDDVEYNDEAKEAEARPATAQSGSASQSRSRTTARVPSKGKPAVVEAEQQQEEEVTDEEESRPASAASATSTTSDKVQSKSAPTRVRSTGATSAKATSGGSAPTRSTTSGDKGRKAKAKASAPVIESDAEEEEGDDIGEESASVPRVSVESAPTGRGLKQKANAAAEGHADADADASGAKSRKVASTKKQVDAGATAVESEANEERTTKSAPAGRAIKPKPKAKATVKAKAGGKASLASAPAASSTVRPVPSRSNTMHTGVEKALPAIPTSSVMGTPASASSAPLSQLAQFANIPPTSPISPGPAQVHSRQQSVFTGGKSEPTRSGVFTNGSSAAAANAHSAPSRGGASSSAKDRQLQQAAREGAEASRGLIDGVITSLLSPQHAPHGPAPQSTTNTAQDPAAAAAARAAAVRPFAPDTATADGVNGGKEVPKELTEAELDMTVEQYIEALYEAKHASMKAEGERAIREFVERAEGGRKRLMALMS